MIRLVATYVENNDLFVFKPNVEQPLKGKRCKLFKLIDSIYETKNYCFNRMQTIRAIIDLGLDLEIMVSSKNIQKFSDLLNKHMIIFSVHFNSNYCELHYFKILNIIG